MFEAVITICAVMAGDPCRAVLLPGYEAASQAQCEANLQSRTPEQNWPEGQTATNPASCMASGSALAVEELRPGVFVHLGAIAEPGSENGGDVSNLGFVIGERAVAVIDSGTTRALGEALYRAIRSRTDLPIAYVILTHMHPDHVFGATILAEAGAQIIGHPSLPRALADRQENYLQSLTTSLGQAAMIGTQSPAIDLLVDGEMQLDLGGKTLSLRTWPIAHSPTDLTVVLEEDGLLFAGDLVFDRHSPALDGSLRGWQNVLDQLESQPLRAVIPGHGGPLLPWPSGMTPMKNYLEILAVETRQALDQGQRLGEAVTVIGQSAAPHWQLFEVFNPRNATVAYTELEWE
ncbi:MAG: quinoprotein relay system zinc metallohydrolase 2 [Mangrovicoccus sp.]